MNGQLRLTEERVRLGLTQEAMADAGGVKKRAYCYYESGERQPDMAFLAGIAAIGADVRYIVTGKREGPPPLVLSADERELLTLFRAASLAGKAAAIGALQGVAAASSPKVVIHGKVGNQFETNQGEITIHMGDEK